MTFRPIRRSKKYFQKWQRKGIWQAIHDELRGELREDLGREANSSIWLTDKTSQPNP